MSLVEPQLPFDEKPQPNWQPAKGKAGCGRDPAAGPGTCWHWWEGCPNAAKRGCYQLWWRSQNPTA